MNTAVVSTQKNDIMNPPPVTGVNNKVNITCPDMAHNPLCSVLLRLEQIVFNDNVLQQIPSRIPPNRSCAKKAQSKSLCK